jgi:hypothetical protein
LTKGVDSVVERGVGSRDGSVHFLNRVVHQVGTRDYVVLQVVDFFKKRFVVGQLPIQFVGLQLLEVRHIKY